MMRSIIVQNMNDLGNYVLHVLDLSYQDYPSPSKSKMQTHGYFQYY